MQNINYWKQVFEEAEAKRLETTNTLTVAAAVAMVCLAFSSLFSPDAVWPRGWPPLLGLITCLPQGLSAPPKLE